MDMPCMQDCARDGPNVDQAEDLFGSLHVGALRLTFAHEHVPMQSLQREVGSRETYRGRGK